MRRPYLAALVAGLLLAGGIASGAVRNGQAPPDPPQDTAFVSRRCVTRLIATSGGTIDAQTTGGALRRGRDGGWSVVPGTIDAAPPLLWNGETVTLGAAGRICVGPRELALPPETTGTHVTAITRQGGSLVCALYGDAALYRCVPPAADAGGTASAVWTRLPVVLPDAAAARQITALAATDHTLTLGTRRDGLWEQDGPTGAWHSVALTQAGPCSDDAEAMIAYNGRLYVSTLEDGLVVYDGTDWTHVAAPTLSTNAPRQMIVFQNALYIRNGSGTVDRLTGSVWTRNVWAGLLPRKQVSALATDGETLYAAQWGGWSAWDGAHWTHSLTLPEFQGLPITALLPDGSTLWVGTQGKGLVEVDRQSGVVRSYQDERSGLPDDWITCLARDGDCLYAGTFVGGIACRHKGERRWTVAPRTAGENATDLAVLGEGQVLAATRHGLRSVGASPVTLPESVTAATVEAQALCGTESRGLWVGTRTGIRFVRLPAPP